ncbi:hypothetical protein ASE31_14555 [Acidovorax sp. Root217]|nr:hypothetical protein ASE31_14555 [Acidovorax sp. Root217]
MELFVAVVLSAELEVSILNRAFNDQSPSSTIFYQQKMAAGATPQSWEAYAFQFGANYQHLSSGALALKIVTNMGMSYDIGLQGALVSYLDAIGKENVGIVAVQLGHALLGLENATGDMAVYNAPAAAWAKEIAEAYMYSTNSANGVPSPKGAPAGAAAWSSAAEHQPVDAAIVQLVGVDAGALLV